MTYTTAGHGRFRLEGARLTTSAGDMVLAYSDAPFEYSNQGPGVWVFHAVCFDPWSAWTLPDSFVQRASGLYHAHVGLLRTRQRIEDAFRRLITDVLARDATETLAKLRDNAAGTHRGARAMTELRLELGLAALHEIVLLVDADAHETAHLDPRIVSALQIITGDLAARHDLTTLARTAGLSTSRFVHLFREQLGMPPRQAIRTLRLHQAALLLAYSNDPVGTIAEELGFSAIFDLSRGFKRVYGLSPTAYRQLFRAQRPRLRHREPDAEPSATPGWSAPDRAPRRSPE